MADMRHPQYIYVSTYGIRDIESAPDTMVYNLTTFGR